MRSSIRIAVTFGLLLGLAACSDDTSSPDYWNQGGGAGGSAGGPGHNANMLDPDFKRVGIGRSGSYWGQIFGR